MCKSKRTFKELFSAKEISLTMFDWSEWPVDMQSVQLSEDDILKFNLKLRDIPHVMLLKTLVKSWEKVGQNPATPL